MSNSVTLADGAYAVNPAASRVAWHGSKTVGAGHTGTVAIKSGNLSVKNGQLDGGSFVLDMTTIKSDDGLDALVQHLNKDDFFGVAAYPEAQLVITGVNAGASAGACSVKADLTIKGHTNPIEFTATLEGTDTGLAAAADFTIDRSLWDVRFGSGKFFQNLGDNLIKDEIGFKVSLQASRS